MRERDTDRVPRACRMAYNYSKKCRYNFWSQFFPSSPLLQHAIRNFVPKIVDIPLLHILISGTAGASSSSSLNFSQTTSPTGHKLYPSVANRHSVGSVFYASSGFLRLLVVALVRSVGGCWLITTLSAFCNIIGWPVNAFGDVWANLRHRYHSWESSHKVWWLIVTYFTQKKSTLLCLPML